MVTSDVDINDDEAWEALLQLQLRVEELNFTVKPIVSWISAFEAHYASNRKAASQAGCCSWLT
jgi:hypothetical protein